MSDKSEGKVQLFAELDIKKGECRVMPIENDPWNDFGYWLEVTGFMAYQAMKYREWNKQQILDYIKEYIEKCIGDYKIKRDNTKHDAHHN